MGPGWGQNLEALQEHLPGVQADEGMDASGEVELKARVQAGTIQARRKKEDGRFWEFKLLQGEDKVDYRFKNRHTDPSSRSRLVGLEQAGRSRRSFGGRGFPLGSLLLSWKSCRCRQWFGQPLLA